MAKYWASVVIRVSYEIGLYDEDYIEADSDEEAEEIARQKAMEDVYINNATFTENDIDVICVSEVEK